jgi:hypothetical protein
MLVSLILSTRVTQQLDQAAAPAGAQVDPLSADREVVQRLRERVQQAEANAVPDAVVDQARGKLAALQASNQEVERRTKAMERLFKEGDARMDVIASELPRLRSEVQRLQVEVDAQSKVSGTKLRAPRRRAVEGMMPVQVVLWRDRVYWINPWIDRLDEPCRAWSEWNGEAVDLTAGPVCDIRECFRGGGQWLIRSVPLRADGGLVVPADSDDWKASLAKLLGRLRADRQVISLKVAPDSHAAFQRVRDAIAESGIAYDVSPIRIDDGVYRDEIRDGVATAQ